MSNTFALFALFALFAIGSAQVTEPTTCTAVQTNCLKADDYIGTCLGPPDDLFCRTDFKCATGSEGHYCGDAALTGKCDSYRKCKSVKKACGDAGEPCVDKTNVIGLCEVDSTTSAKTCATADVSTLCKGVQEHKPCTAGTSGSAIKGRCDASNKCQYIEFVKVEYTIQANEQKEETTAAVAKKVASPGFDTGMDSSLTNNVVKANSLLCSGTGVPMADANGTYTCPVEAGSACALACNTNYKPKGVTRRCGEHGYWLGEKGACAKHCKTAETGFTFTASTGKLSIANKVSDGTIECPDVFHDTQCSLRCKSGFRVKTPIAYKCTITENANAWVQSTAGVCEAAVDVLASTEVVLAHSDDAAKITRSEDDTFNAAFRAAVMANMPSGNTILAENIIITNISVLDNKDARRLNEKSVQVDYTVQVADSNDAAELDKEDGGLLPVGGVLRGLRLG